MKESDKSMLSEYEQSRGWMFLPKHDSIDLLDGRSISVGQLFCYETYGGLLLGQPHSELNQEELAGALSQAKGKIWGATEPKLIPPVLREPQLTERDWKRPEVRRQSQYLPNVTCFSQLESSSPAKDDSMFGSKLTVVWFQDRYPFPIDEHVRASLKELDWNRLAVDYCP